MFSTPKCNMCGDVATQRIYRKNTVAGRRKYLWEVCDKCTPPDVPGFINDSMGVMDAFKKLLDGDKGDRV